MKAGEGVLVEAAALVQVGGRRSAGRAGDASAAPRPCSGHVHSVLGEGELARVNKVHLEHLECNYQPHIQGRGAQKRTQRAG